MPKEMPKENVSFSRKEKYLTFIFYCYNFELNAATDSETMLYLKRSSFRQ